jgi:hypothetical protein
MSEIHQGTGYKRGPELTERHQLPRDILANSMRIEGDILIANDTDAGTFDSSQAERLTMSAQIAAMPRCSYDQNNGVVAFKTADDEFRIAPYSRRLSLALTEAGYVSTGVFVPLSNGEQLAIPEQRGEWALITARVNVQRNEDRVEACRQTYLAEARVRGITHGLTQSAAFEGRLIKADGAQFLVPPEGAPEIYPSAFDHTLRDELTLRAPQVGRYATNNGLLAFVDESGTTYVVKGTERKDQIMRAAGYKEGGVVVPFSNGEILVDPDLLALMSLLGAEPY